MAFHGDTSSFPLPELLQWLDSSRKSGALQLSWDAGERRIFVVSGQVAATSSASLWERIARVLEVGQLAQGTQVLAAFGDMQKSGELEASFRARGLDPALPVHYAKDELTGVVADLIAAQSAHFHWSEDADRSGEEWVAAEMSLRHLLFEALRWVDEAKDVAKALPLDSMMVRAKQPSTPELPLVQRIILNLCSKGQTVGRLRLALGVSRSTATRWIYDLLRAKRVDVEGAPDLENDPVSEMLEKGAILVRERQFEAAGLVFSALLASDPSDRRVREFARMVEREYIAALYQELAPLYVPQLHDDPLVLSRLRPEERQIVELVNGKWDVSTIVLASQQRELETLKCLHKLHRLGLLAPAAGAR